MNNPDPTLPTGDPARTATGVDATPAQGASTEPLTGSPPPYASYSSPETPFSRTDYSYQPQSAPAQQYAPPIGAYPPQSYPPPTAPAQPTDLHRRRSAPIVGPVILIGAGVVFLLNSLDILPWSIWNQVWRLWPLVLIAVGLDLLIGRRNPVLSLLLVLLVVGTGILFLVYGGGFQSAGSLVSVPLSIPLNSAKSAQVTLELGTGDLTLNSGAPDQSLATGTLQYFQNSGPPDQNISVAGDKAIVTLSQIQRNSFDFGSWFDQKREPEWNLHLNPSVPISIDANLGTGNSTLDFSGLKVTDVGVNSGTGNTTLIFPAVGQVTGKVDGGVGNLSLKIPDSLQARLDVSSGLGNVNIDSRFTKQGDNIYTTKGFSEATNKLDLKLDVGVGNVEVSP